MRNDLTTAFLVASGESALLEAGATSTELSAIRQRIPDDVIAREVMMWQNPQQWAKYTLVMERLHGTGTGADPAEQPS